MRARLARREAESSLLRIVMLGDFAVYRGAARIAESGWQGRKVKNLLAVLLQHCPRMLSTDELLELFWPDAALDKGKHSLYMTIYRRASRFGAGGGAGSPSATSASMRRATASMATRRTAWTWTISRRGPRRGGGPVARATAARRWPVWWRRRASTAATICRTRRTKPGLKGPVRRCGAPTRRCSPTSRRCISKDGHAEMAETYARKLVTSDPTREESYRLLMRIVAQRGLRDEVQRVYRACCRMLETDVGVAPMPETVALYQSLL